uniref:Uncharacterized protein n=1 Tax=Rhizophora mucronata TaxID=61149 RepID=A0A2P2NDM1_RHIMU
MINLKTKIYSNNPHTSRKKCKSLSWTKHGSLKLPTKLFK